MFPIPQKVYNASQQVFDVIPKSYGKTITASHLPEGMAKFFAATDLADSPPNGPGVRKDLLIPIVKGVIDLVTEIRDAVAETEMRMVAGSLLIIWEGDESALESALDRKMDEAMNAKAQALPKSKSVSTRSDLSSPTPPYLVRLIDFAHTHAVPGQGPDEGALKGIDTSLRLFQSRLAELQ